VSKQTRGRKVAHVKIETGGRKVPGLPFQGETMTCALCDAQQQSDPTMPRTAAVPNESGWRMIQLDGRQHYVCPQHFPPDESATVEQFRLAYIKVLKAIIEIEKSKND
jgi:hypothetical protein